MKVDKSKIRNPDEEYAYLMYEIDHYGGDELACHVHSNRLRVINKYKEKIRRKLRKLVDSPEFLDYNPIFKQQIKKPT